MQFILMPLIFLLFRNTLLFAALGIARLRCICWLNSNLGGTVLLPFLKADVVFDQKLEELSFVVFRKVAKLNCFRLFFAHLSRLSTVISNLYVKIHNIYSLPLIIKYIT